MQKPPLGNPLHMLRGERLKFLKDEWPKIHATIQRLGLDAEELLQPARAARRR